MSFAQALGFRRGMTLVEVMIASALAVGITLTSIGSILYYTRTTAKNDKVAKLSNLLEAQMEKVKSFTWYQLVNPVDGIFPPGGPGNSTWPGPSGPFVRYEATSLFVELIKDGQLAATDYSGLNGESRVFFTPITITHSATSRLGTQVYYDVNYYKVEVVVSLKGTDRIRPTAEDATDDWVAVTYLSELQGRSDAEFSQRVLETLRGKQRA